MSVIIGPPVEKDNFFGREENISKFITLIMRGISILLSGPRRVGKTSLALKLIRLLKNQDWHCIYITVEGVHDIPGFVNRIIDAMKKDQSFWKKSGSNLEQFFKTLNLDLNLGPIKLSKKSDTISETLLLETLSKSIQTLSGNIFIVMDELPIFLRSLEKNKDSEIGPDQVLECLRAMRQAAITDENYKVVWLFSGSISLEHYAASRQLSYAINDLQSNQLSSYSIDDAIAYLEFLSNKYLIDLSPEMKNYFLDKIQWHIPFYINIVFDAVLEFKNITINEETIDNAYKKSIEKYKKEFDYQIQRLITDHNNSDLYITLLKLIAKQKKVTLEAIKANFVGTQWENLSEEDFLYILDLLEHDGYILFENNFYTFRSPLLRDFIINKYHL